MSIVLIEALAAGAILVASDIPEIAESVHDGENGLLVKDYENPEAIAEAIGGRVRTKGATDDEGQRPSKRRTVRTRPD